MINFLLGVLCCGLAVLPFILYYLAEIENLKDRLKGMKEDYKLKEVNIKPHKLLKEEAKKLCDADCDYIEKIHKGLQDSKEGKIHPRNYKRKKNVKAPKSKRN